MLEPAGEWGGFAAVEFPGARPLVVRGSARARDGLCQRTARRFPASRKKWKECRRMQVTRKEEVHGAVVLLIGAGANAEARVRRQTHYNLGVGDAMRYEIPPPGLEPGSHDASKSPISDSTATPSLLCRWPCAPREARTPDLEVNSLTL